MTANDPTERIEIVPAGQARLIHSERCRTTTRLGSYEVSCVREVSHSQLHKSDRGSEWGPSYAFLSRDEECPGLPECAGPCCRSLEELHPEEIM